MNRKDTLKALLRPDIPTPGPPATEVAGSELTERVGSSAVRSMGMTLQKLSAEASEAKVLRDQIDAGLVVFEIEPELIDPSFVLDRLGLADDNEFQQLVESIEAHGQQVPILVRPHPTTAGRYQIAFGHRRWRAAKALRRKIRAVTRPLSDPEMVVAQGKENSERRNLSFIERALFTLHLEERGFSRAIIISALSVDKTEVARLLSVAKSVPLEIIHAIGPAPKAGRPRWIAMAERLKLRGADPSIRRLMSNEDFLGLESDLRFARLFSALADTPPNVKDVRDWKDPGGRTVVRIERTSDRVSLRFDGQLAPGFGDFITGRLSDLFAEYAAKNG